MHFKPRFPKEGEGKSPGFFLLIFFLSVGFFLTAKLIPIPTADALKAEMIRASRHMAQAVKVIHKCKKDQNYFSETEIASSQPALIGLEFSEITTSIGWLEAKRTSLNPNFAALIVLLFKEAGVKQGDTIAIGASASFPALIIAAFSACWSLNLKPLAIISLGASQWGANDPNFHWLRMQDCLVNNGTLDHKPIAISFGGGRDVGEEMSPEGLALLQRDIEESGLLFLKEPNLEENVRMRMKAYMDAAGGKSLRAFINIGGSYANMGTDPKILEVEPGLSYIKRFPSPEKRGMIFTMAQRQIPIIHLLYIRGLAERYGFPWNPREIPVPGEGSIYSHIREKTLSFLLIGVIYLLVISGVLLFKKNG